jgi:FkbM family methyltransferase
MFSINQITIDIPVMKSLIKKFTMDFRIDAKATLRRTIRYMLQIAADIIADGFYFVSLVPLFFMPARTLARIKHTLSPTVSLDYVHSSIKLQADSLLDLYRARACEKEPETVNWIESYLQAGDVFYDVGANVGAYSLIACAHNKGSGIVHAFEPSFSTYYQLCRNIILNDCQQKVIPHMIGLTDNTGMAMFNYKSLEAGSAEHWLEADLLKASTEFVYSQPLLVFSIDHLINEFEFPVPNHIKLDVDGTEVDVLRGAEETLRKCKLKSILVEVRDTDGMGNEVDEILTDAGFHLVTKTNRGDNIRWNCIYARDKLVQPSTHER